MLSEIRSLKNNEEGTLYWNFKTDQDVFVKCKGNENDWIKFNEITLSGVGKLKGKAFIDKTI